MGDRGFLNQIRMKRWCKFCLPLLLFLGCNGYNIIDYKKNYNIITYQINSNTDFKVIYKNELGEFIYENINDPLWKKSLNVNNGTYSISVHPINTDSTKIVLQVLLNNKWKGSSKAQGDKFMNVSFITVID